LDACNLKGQNRGQLLYVIGKDVNDNMFTIEYAVVEAETKASWEWFIRILIDDIYVKKWRK
jgi:hypothetical protein